MSSSVLLELKDVHTHIGAYHILHGVNLQIPRGELTLLLGRNGAGKTTTLRTIMGLWQASQGDIQFNGHNITHMNTPDIASLNIGYVPENMGIFSDLTVEENMLAILETTTATKKERKERCEELLTRFGIEHIAKNEALTLSGGEKRRLTIARSLVTNPSLLMLDEPFSGVDPIAVHDVQQIIQDLRAQGLAILITDHNVRETLNIVDRAYLIFEGRVESQGNKDFLLNDPISRKLYLGESFTM